MPKIGKSTDKLPAHVMWVEQNDHEDHLFTTMGIGKLQKRKMYENQVLPVLIVRNYHDKFHMIGKTDISYRLCGEEDYKNLEKGKWVEMNMGHRYVFKTGDMDFIAVWFYFGWHFDNIHRNMCCMNEAGVIPRRDGAPPPPIDE